MALWGMASWQGPPDSNYNGPTVECRGLVLHIAEGSYEGTISWMKNPVSDVSSHFVIARDGRIAQMLDTAVTAWTQAAGNGHWVSVENEGFSTDGFTDAQSEANAQLYAWLLSTHGVPAQLANSPSETGLGWHGMGGVAWGNHPNCPGSINVAKRPAILARAIQINGGGGPPPNGGAMSYTIRSGASDGSIYLVPGGLAPSGKIAVFAIYGSEYAVLPQVQLPDGVTIPATGLYDINPQPWTGGGSGGGPSLAEITAAVRAELNKTKVPSVPGQLGV